MKAIFKKTVKYKGVYYDPGAEINISDADKEELKAKGAEIIQCEIKTDGDPLANATVDELIAYAKENDIDIGNATSQKGIYGKIKAAQQEGG